MKAQVRFRSGARAGQVETFEKGYLGLGRDPLSDVRFDADRDLDVSSKHAAIIRRDDAFIVRDLGSKNGTFVNGRQVAGDVPLKDGDVIAFGAHGPSVEFHIINGAALERISDAARASAARMSAPRDQFRAVAASGATQPRSSTALRIAEEVARQTRGLRRTTKALLVLLVACAGAFGWVQWTSARQARAERDLLGRYAAELASLRDALRQSQVDAARLRSELQTAGSSGDAASVARLRQRLDSAEARQRGLTDATHVDYRTIAARNTDAVALVLVKFSDVELFSGTAFAVDSQGTLVTNKHVLVGEDGGRRPLGIAVKFSGSKQWFQGRMVGVADSADVGVLKVDIRGGTPRVVGFAGSRGPARGDPVAIIGYPLGEDLPMERQGSAAIADPTLTVGTVSKVLKEVVQVDGYGAPGSSGSPIFDKDGRVVAVLYGGNRESQGKIIFGVPGTAVVAYLRQLGLLR